MEQAVGGAPSVGMSDGERKTTDGENIRAGRLGSNSTLDFNSEILRSFTSASCEIDGVSIASKHSYMEHIRNNIVL